MIERVIYYIGTMSGSSLDGLDVALVQFTCDPKGNVLNWNIDDVDTFPYEDDIVAKLQQFRKLTTEEYLRFETEYSTFVAGAINQFLAQHEISKSGIQAVGHHGHTLVHIPEEGISVQLGNEGVIAALTSLTTVGDFRIQDVQKGGKGAPLVHIVERDLFDHFSGFLNLGGIANISIIEEGLSYDICPFNQVLNHFARSLGKPYDDGGNLASTGQVDRDVVERLQDMPYISQKAPKSIDNGWISTEVLPYFEGMKAKDALATAVNFFAEAIYRSFPKEGKILITGGGAYNTFFIDQLSALCSVKQTIVVPQKSLVEGKEALLMAYMTHLRLHNIPNIDCRFTGAESSTSAGAIYTAHE